MKGIILAGGAGTRLSPLTLAMSKQLMPIYDKPMIYYPLTTLLYSGIRDILLISTPNDLPHFERLLGDGSQYGCNFNYAIQEEPNGLAQAFIIGKDFIGKDKVSLILGDNIFYMKRRMLNDCQSVQGGLVFAYHVNNPGRYGVVEFNKDNKVLSIEEKPQNPKSNYAVTGLYFYDNTVIDIAKSIKLSVRGEYEITDVNKVYLKNNKLDVKLLGRGAAWLDTGTFNSLSQASQFVQVIEQRQGLKIGCIEEAAFKMRYIDESQLLTLANTFDKSGYGKYLEKIVRK